jgi:hypothetical protein
MKMHHIDKLWPEECHEVHTKNFACKPWMDLIHIAHMVPEDGVNIQPHLEIVHKVRENLYQSNAVFKLVDILGDLGPTVATPILPHSEVHVSPD